MRVYALYIVVAFLVVYAWKDWFKCLCFLIVMMAFIERKDMPRSIMGIQGLNSWNILMVSIVLAWLTHRRREGLTWDAPRYFNVLLLLVLGVFLVGFGRMMLDRDSLRGTLGTVLSDHLINPIKWVVPGVLLFDGCRTHRRLRLAVMYLFAMYVLLSVQIIRQVPLSSVVIVGGDGAQGTRDKACRRIGYSAPSASAMLAGASWALVAGLPWARRKGHKALLLAGAGITAVGQAMTGGRAGYLAWGIVGFTLCLIRWRKSLLLAPIVPILLWIALPGVAERMLAGFGETDLAGNAVTDDFVVTSGRTQIWPHVIDKIGESPMIGYGRRAMIRTGLSRFIAQEYGDSFPHPHNMYLELLLDNGIIGAIPVLLVFVTVVVCSARLFQDPNPFCATVGGVALSLTVAQLAAGIGAQHFYPSESTLGMWVAIFLAFRVSLERSRLRNGVHGALPGMPALRGYKAHIPVLT